MIRGAKYISYTTIAYEQFRAIATQREGKGFSTSADPFPKMLREDASKYGDMPAIRKRRYGIWNTYSWQSYYDNMKYISLWMMSEGLQRGEKIGIIDANDPQCWYLAVGAQTAAGIELDIDNNIQYGHNLSPKIRNSLKNDIVWVSGRI